MTFIQETKYDHINETIANNNIDFVQSWPFFCDSVQITDYVIKLQLLGFEERGTYYSRNLGLEITQGKSCQCHESLNDPVLHVKTVVSRVASITTRKTVSTQLCACSYNFFSQGLGLFLKNSILIINSIIQNYNLVYHVAYFIVSK